MSTAIELLIIVILGAIGGAIFITMWEWGKRRARKDNVVSQGADVVAEQVARLVVQQFGSSLDKLQDVEELTQVKLKLEQDLANLRKERDGIEETFSTKQRELEHAAGLLRKELDQELVAAKQNAQYEAQTTILAKEREFNAEQMELVEKRFESELKTLNELVTTLTERLPDVSARLRLKGEV